MVSVFTYFSMAMPVILVLLILPKWIRVAKKFGFTGKDMNKVYDNNIAEAGGLIVVLGFVFGFFVYIGFQVFYHKVTLSSVLPSFAAATTILLAAFIGFVDDILGWKAGISRRYKFLLTLLIPLPIMVLNAGNNVMNFPLFGTVDFGIIYPLFIVPLGIIGTSNGFNILAGYNGLEVGMGALLVSALGLLAFLENHFYLAGLCIMMLSALLGFYVFNKYPARVFPGDSLTYSVGALIGVVAILANIEKFALILFTPYFLELFLKLRGKAKKESWARPKEDGSLENLYDKWYSVPHVVISFWNKVKGSVTEKQVVLSIWFIELIFVSIAFLSYFRVISV